MKGLLCLVGFQFRDAMLAFLEVCVMRLREHIIQECMPLNLPCAHIAAPIWFETVNTNPTKGMPSNSAAANPNADGKSRCKMMGMDE